MKNMPARGQYCALAILKMCPADDAPLSAFQYHSCIWLNSAIPSLYKG